MSDYYADSSAIVKRYVSETGSSWVQSLCDDADNILYIGAVTPVEIVASIVRRVRTGMLSGDAARMANTEFRTDLADEYEAVRFTDSLRDNAMRLAEVHG